MEIFYYLLGFLIVIFTIVTVHEGGHFLAARFFKVGVTNFSIGMGPVILSKIIGQTSYEIRLLPLGGFVKMVGDVDPSSTLREEQVEIAKSLSEAQQKQSFYNKPRWQKAIIVFAGPLANFIFGVMTFIFLYMSTPHQFTVPVVDDLVEGSPAEVAGLQVGDLIIEANGFTVDDFAELKQIISVGLERDLLLTVVRDTSQIDFQVRPDIVETTNFIGEKALVGQIGVISRTSETKTLGFVEAVDKSVNQFKHALITLGTAMSQIFQGERSVADMGGPVKIAEVSGKAFQISITFFIFIMATLSINLGVINLLPIPVLDGGHLLIYAIEGITGSKLNAKALEVVQKGAVVFLLTLMIFISYHDIYSLIERKLLAG